MPRTYFAAGSEESTYPDLVSFLPRDPVAPASRWLTGGMAVLNDAGEVLELNEVLGNWLGLNKETNVAGNNFWDSLWAVEPEWKALIAAGLESAGTFARWDLSIVSGQTRQWFCLERARHSGISFVQLNSILPALKELEEGASEEFLQNESARRQVFFRLLRAEGQLNNLVRRWPGVIFSQRVDFTFRFASPKIEELTGVPLEEWQRAPQRFWQVVHEGDLADFQQQLRQATQNGQVVTGVYRIRNLKTGRIAYVLEQREVLRTRHGVLLGYEGVWLDITRQTIAEKRLSTAAWKETLAVLTMGLAHDFSNIMAGIHSLSEHFQAQVGQDDPFHEGLGLIKGNSIQASQLIQRILHLHHGKIGERNYHNLNELVTEIFELVRKIVPRHIRMESGVAPQALPVYADVVEFRQVLINLALNAVDAMAQGGRLTFRVSRHESYPSFMHVQGTLPRLPSVCIAIEDEGCGIPARTMSSVFDPFFTTKSSEKGSGLGLYNAQLFAEKHHGAIAIDSTENKGTTVYVWLPEADFTEAERDPIPLTPQRRTLLVFGLAEGGRARAAEFLRESGFSAVVASSEEEVAELLQRSDYALAAVILLVSGGDRCYGRVAELVRRSGSPINIVVQIAGCNEDELEPELLRGADVVLPTDLARPDSLSRITALLSKRP